jgi:uncharacterized protein (DUF58 family)
MDMMNAKSIALVFVCVVIAFYLKLEWLAYLLVIVLVLVSLSSVRRPVPEMAAVPAGERDTIYPVVYEDVGAPYLYSPKTSRIKITPKWQGPNTLADWASEGAGWAVRGTIGAFTGGRKVGKEK